MCSVASFKALKEPKKYKENLDSVIMEEEFSEDELEYKLNNSQEPLRKFFLCDSKVQENLEQILEDGICVSDFDDTQSFKSDGLETVLFKNSVSDQEQKK